MIEFKCRHCGTLIRARPELADTLGKCPKCATANHIPPAEILSAIMIDEEPALDPRVAGDARSQASPDRSFLDEITGEGGAPAKVSAPAQSAFTKAFIPGRSKALRMVLMGLVFLGSLLATIAIVVAFRIAFMGARPDGPKPPGTPTGPELRTQPDTPAAESQPPGKTVAKPAKPAPIRNPAEAIAALESADKEAAARGRRWLAIAKVTAADRGNVTSALKRHLDTPDAGQRSEIVRAYCRWSLQSPDVPTLLTILRFPSQYRDCWPPAFVPQVVKAKPGYAVGAIYVRGGGGFDAFKPIFMRVKDKGLDTKDSYEGPQVGGTGGGEGTVGGDGNFIIGLHGKVNDQGKIEALSAVSLATETSPASGNRGPAAKIGPQTVGKPVADPAKLKGQIRRDDAPVK